MYVNYKLNLFYLSYLPRQLFSFLFSLSWSSKMNKTKIKHEQKLNMFRNKKCLEKYIYFS